MYLIMIYHVNNAKKHDTIMIQHISVLSLSSFQFCYLATCVCSPASLCGVGYVDGEQTNKEKQEGVLFCFVLLCCGCGCCVLCFAGVGGFCT